ncbi:MAG TPA: PfkB family carbohydrate kinase, partial [Cellvibrio sp.]|nr:PfkB family carbohydrate kinase [Cellvibrio sp.]
IVIVPAYGGSQVQDTIGAGDTFYGAFIARLYEAVSQHKSWNDDKVLRRSLQIACAAAAINVTRVGCQPPLMTEIEAVIEGRTQL